MASKNMRSDGYIQLPDSLTPLSFSLFAGFAPSELSTGDARGMVDISRSTPRDLGAVDASGVAGDMNLEKRPLGGGGVWSICEESQLLPLLASLASMDAPWKVLVDLDLSHAARVSASTGQASAVFSGAFDMFAEYKQC